jgi:hypothetical protein
MMPLILLYEWTRHEAPQMIDASTFKCISTTSA